MLLAGDVGGTKTNLAIFDPEQGPSRPLVEATFSSMAYPGLEEVVLAFFSQLKAQSINIDQISRASFGVAGPVIDQQATITNLPWVMNSRQLAETFKVPVVELINDLVAVATAVPSLDAADLQPLNAGEAVAGGPIVVVAPGTGLGEAYLIWDGQRYRAYPSEGGHTDFAPTNDLEMGLLRFLQAQYDHVSYERVCSGSGLPNIYAYLKESGYATEPAWLAEQLAATSDPTPIIVNVALNQDQSCSICRETLNMFVSILARETGNMALNILAAGGVYLGGGIPPRILPALKSGAFIERFQRKGRFARLLKGYPVRVILNPKAALIGAACHGLGL
jgi:glucokinase